MKKSITIVSFFLFFIGTTAIFAQSERSSSSFTWDDSKPSPAVAALKAKPAFTGTDGGACSITDGPNSGKSGTYDSGWCCTKTNGGGDCTECVTSDGSSNGKCKDAKVLKGGQATQLPTGPVAAQVKSVDLKPDLRNVSYNNAILTIKIRNHGTAKAPATITEFFSKNPEGAGQKQYIATPEIPSGGFVEIKAKHPYKNCERVYEVTADYGKTVKESNETNNMDDNCDVD